MALCEGEEQRASTIDLVENIDLGLMIFAQIITYVVLIYTTAVLFFGRSKKQRPLFVFIQVTLLWLSQFSFTTFNIWV